MDITTQNKTRYNQWCNSKITNFTDNLNDLFVEIADPSRLSKAERQKIISIISQNNLCFFELQKSAYVEKSHIRLLADSVGMCNYESCNTSDDSYISEISNETNYSIVIKQSFIDGVFTIFSFGLYTPTTIILKK